MSCGGGGGHCTRFTRGKIKCNFTLAVSVLAGRWRERERNGRVSICVREKR